MPIDWRRPLAALLISLPAWQMPGAWAEEPQSSDSKVPAWLQDLPQPYDAEAPMRWGPVAAVAPDAAAEIDIVLWTEKPRHAVGDLLELSVSVSFACHLTLIEIDRDGRAIVLFPNALDDEGLIAPGVAVRIPGRDAGYQVRLDRPGPETFIAVCQHPARRPEGIGFDFEKRPFTVLGDWKAFVAGAGQKEGERARKGRKSNGAAPEPPAGGRIGRTAIKIEVRE